MSKQRSKGANYKARGRFKRKERRKREGQYQHDIVMPFVAGETHDGRCMKLVPHPTIPDACCYRMAGHELVDDFGCDADIAIGSFVQALSEFGRQDWPDATADYGPPTDQLADPELTVCRTCARPAIEHSPSRQTIFGVCP